MSEWIEKPLGEVTSYIAKGIPPKYTEKLTEDSIYVLNQKCNRDFVISYDAARLHDLTQKKVAEEKMVQPGDVLINSTGEGTAGRVAQIWDLPYPTTTDGHMILIRPTAEVDPLYYGYAVKLYQSRIETLAEGSTGQTEINKRRLQDEIIICFPKNKDEQHRIAEVFENIDKKIAVNKKINRNLEEQQSLLYSYYFENDLYKTCKVKDAVCFSQGVQVPVEEQLTECKNGYTQFIRIVDVAQDNSDIRYIKHVDRANIKEKDVFMVRYGSQTAGMVARGKNGIIANNLFTISSEILSNEYLYCYFGSKSVKDYLKGNSTSSTMPAINFATLNGMDIAIPNQDILTEFSSIAQSLFEQQLLLIKQNKNLQGIRDGLLPRLMSN